ncbi:chromate efflux transporter [Argonema antarcticum]|uniref:chromate efflux transporter n=1 Tax=Argonema antarcticum TaxID=2942763 RepID=UPI0020122FD9|nr:chromate efflux transporter [Argonema antarcticum]MCL1472078.1 chromate efflux transporter [Argonema antarcticum A004/B2]
MTNDQNVSQLSDLAKVFLKLGAIGFGGPAAHIAMMEDEVVKRRQWIDRSHFLDLVGATNLIPGPNSTEMAIHIGYIRAGWLGLIVAGVCFILPAVIITGGFAWIYAAFGTLPQVAPLLYGIKPAVLGVILNAIWRLGKTALKAPKLLIIALFVSLALFLGLNEVVALLLGGLLGMIWLGGSDPDNPPPGEQKITIAAGLASVGTLKVAATTGTAVAGDVPLWQLGLFFLKVGSVLFGSGYVLVAFLEGGLVQEYGWLTQQQLLDAIAIGQFTPGPVLSTATFIGYIIAGFPGAIVATVGIFLPSFFFVAALNPLIPRLRSSKWSAAFLDAVNVSSIALMAVVTAKLAAAILTDWLPMAIALIAAVLAIRFRINAAWLVLGGALIGWVANFIIF